MHEPLPMSAVSSQLLNDTKHGPITHFHVYPIPHQRFLLFFENILFPLTLPSSPQLSSFSRMLSTQNNRLIRRSTLHPQATCSATLSRNLNSVIHLSEINNPPPYRVKRPSEFPYLPALHVYNCILSYYLTVPYPDSVIRTSRIHSCDFFPYQFGTSATSQFSTYSVHHTLQLSI